MRSISSRDNPQFKALKKLCQRARERQKNRQVILDGMHLVGAYSERFGAPERLFIRESHRDHADILSLIQSEVFALSGVFIDVLSNALYDEVSSLESASGLLAIISLPEETTPPDLDADSVLLDGLQDPGNVGSILRSAAAAGFQQVLLSGDAAQAWSPKTLRAGMGAHFLLTIYERQNLAEFMARYRGQSIVTALDASRSLYALDLKKPVAWVVGHEGQGCRPEVIKAASCAVKIPMPGKTESLNVAATTAICLFETLRQREGKTGF